MRRDVKQAGRPEPAFEEGLQEEAAEKEVEMEDRESSLENSWLDRLETCLQWTDWDAEKSTQNRRDALRDV